MTPNREHRWYNVKVSEEARTAAQVIQSHYKPDMEMQEIYSMAVLEYLRAYYPNLEREVATIMRRRQEARRGDGARSPAPE